MFPLSKAVMGVAMIALVAQRAQASEEPPFRVASGGVEGHPQWTYWEIEVALDRAELRLVDQKGGAPLQAMVPPDAWAAINGGYWLHDYKPTGWAKDTKRQIGKRKSPGAVGVIAIKGKDVYAGAIKSLPIKDPDFAIQNSPVLIHADGTIGIKKDDGRKAARTVACVNQATRDATGRLRFILLQTGVKSGPTLMETAKLMKEIFRCDAALNLDGGPSTGIWLKSDLKIQHSLPSVPIGYGIAILSAARTGGDTRP